MSALVVALETSSRSSSVAVRSADELREIRLEPGRAHASDLVPTLDRALREFGRTAAEITSVLVGTGPGSYTGLRVGIATALGIARGCGAALRGVPSGETLCYGELAVGEEAVVLLDARAGEIYFAHYRRGPDEVEVLRAPCVLRPDEVADALPATGSIFGDEAAIVAAGLDAGANHRLRAQALPRAESLLALGSLRLARFGAHAPADVRPLYLRPFAVHQKRR